MSLATCVAAVVPPAAVVPAGTVSVASGVTVNRIVGLASSSPSAFVSVHVTTHSPDIGASRAMVTVRFPLLAVAAPGL